MKGLSKKFENIFMAITFAEAGEVEQAREYMREEERSRQIVRVVSSIRPRKELRAPGAAKR